MASIFSHTNSRIIRNLKRDSELLQQQLQQFNVISQEFETKFAYEEYATPVTKGKDILVVPRASAVVPGQVDAEMIAVPANHVNMIRFESEDDVGFIRVSGHLRLMVRKACDRQRLEPEPQLARDTSGPGSDVGAPDSSKRNQGIPADPQRPEALDAGDEIVLSKDDDPKEMTTKLLRSLAFKGMLDPMTSIPLETDGTCDWIFEDSMYRKWESEEETQNHLGVLWIKGHPGTGKSTLMRRAFRQTEQVNTPPTAVTAAFFFSDQARLRLHRTATGFFRCILHQLLLQDQKALHRVTNQFIQELSDQETFEWPDALLQSTAKQVLKSLGSRPVFIFVDALDSCDEDDLDDIKSFIIQSSKRSLRSNGCLKLCVSSRYYRQITIPGALVILAEEGNRDDINRHVTTACQEEPALECVRNTILEKAGGIFLWVVLVAAHLKKNCRGRSAKFLKELVNELPPKLEDLYVRLLQDITPEEAFQTRFLLYVLLFSYEPWNLRCIHTGLCFIVKHFESVQAWEESPDFLETAEKRHEQVLNVSFGLVQATVPSEQGEVKSEGALPDNATVYQFIHATVKDFFINGRGFECIHNAADMPTTSKNAHLALATALTRYLGTNEIRKWVRVARMGNSGWCESYFGMPGFSSSAASDAVNLFDLEDLDPLFDLAARYVFLHLREASFLSLGIDECLRLVGRTGLQILGVLESSLFEAEFPYFLYSIPPWIDEAAPLNYNLKHSATPMDRRRDLQRMRKSCYLPQAQDRFVNTLLHQAGMPVNERTRLLPSTSSVSDWH